MATIIRLADTPHREPPVALNFDDLAVEASICMTEAKAKAAELVAEAQQQADSIRQQAAKEGAEAGVSAVEQMVAEQLAPAVSALQQAAADLQDAKQTWLAQWESNVIHLAVAIAGRVIRSELERRPDISLSLIREALELAAGNHGVRLQLNPEDLETLGSEVQSLIDAASGVGDVELMADDTIGRGGCRVETRFGVIDQQIESQLKRIEEELAA